MIVAASLLGALLALAPAQDREPQKQTLTVVATHPALASIAEQVGGERVSVSSVTRPNWDVHSVEAKPSVFALLRNADLFVRSGLDLELWSDDAVKGSRNQKIRRGMPGNVDASQGIKLLDVPENPSRREGDVHIYGNPHYWMDPLNAKQIARNVAAGLTAIDPGSAQTYLENEKAFDADINKRLRGWLLKAIPKKNTPLVVYHDSFPYFTRRFGFQMVATVEPKPRIPPTQRHLLEVIETIRERGVRVVVREPFHDPQATDFLAEQTGVTVVTLSTLPGFEDPDQTYQEMIDLDLDRILAALG